MVMNEIDYTIIWKKIHEGDLSKKEEALFDRWYSKKDNEETFNTLKKNSLDGTSIADVSDTDEEAWSKVVEKNRKS